MPPSRRDQLQRTRALAAIDAWHRGFDARAALARDPLRFAHRYADPADREVVALLAALMAFGRVAIISMKLTNLFTRLGPSPAATARDESPAQLAARLSTFVHRTFRGVDIAALLAAVGQRLRDDGRVFASLERAWASEGELLPALTRWVDDLRRDAWPDGDIPRAAKHLLPDPRGKSACKRWMLLLRWIARHDEIDLGLAAIPTSALVIPVDVHVHRIARNLGLTRRADASWRTAVEITDALRALSPDDPVRYDLSICHLGIAGHCPSRRDPARCEGCALRPVCIHWR